MQYRRAFQPGGTYFFTVVTCNRIPFLSGVAAVERLQASIQYDMRNHPFRIDALVVLPDHLHTIWTLPPDDDNFATRWRLIKSHFTRNTTERPKENTPSRQRKGEQAIWQRRYWEHLIRDAPDFENHVEYIHYNPVKHGLVSAPIDWPHSSFHEFVERGIYPPDWGAGEIVHRMAGRE